MKCGLAQCELIIVTITLVPYLGKTFIGKTTIFVSHVTPRENN